MDHHQLSANLTIHTHACGEAGIFVNAYLVETPVGVVAVDSTLTESESRALRSEFEALNKPLLAVFVTHPHPDHVAGITNLVAGDSTKIIATQSVIDLMHRLEQPKRELWAPVFGPEWVQRWTYPNTVAESGERFTFDSVTYSVLDIGPGGDAEANSVSFIELPRKTAFLSDLVFEGAHSYVADGHLLAWLANLTRIERLCEDMEIVFPGHGAAGSPQKLISAQRSYLLTLAAHVKELSAGAPSLSDSAKKKLEKRMRALYPDSGLEFLIAMSADPIALEMGAGPLAGGRP